MFMRVLAEAPARPEVFLFPHAGASAAGFAPFARAWAAQFRLLCTDLPGRMGRMTQPPRIEFEPLIADLAAEIAAEPGRDGSPYLLVGSCAGAFLALETARALRSARQPGPAALVVLSCAAPDVAALPYGIAQLPSPVLWDYLLTHGGVPSELADDASFRRLTEPALRADFALFADYRHRPGPPLDTPVVVLHGAADDGLRRGELLGWRRQSTRPLEVRTVPGAGRWLAEEAPDELGRVIAGCLSRSAAPGGPPMSDSAAGQAGQPATWRSSVSG